MKLNLFVVFFLLFVFTITVFNVNANVIVDLQSSWIYSSTFDFKFTSSDIITLPLRFELDIDLEGVDKKRDFPCNWHSIDEQNQVHIWFWTGCYYISETSIVPVGNLVSSDCFSFEFIPQGQIPASQTITCPRRIVSADDEFILDQETTFKPKLSLTHTLTNAADVIITPPHARDIANNFIELRYNPIKHQFDPNTDVNENEINISTLGELTLLLSGSFPSHITLPITFSFWTQPSDQAESVYPDNEDQIWHGEEYITEMGVMGAFLSLNYSWVCGNDLRLYFDQESYYLLTGAQPLTSTAISCSIPMNFWSIIHPFTFLSSQESGIPFVLGETLHLAVHIGSGEDNTTVANLNTNVTITYQPFSEIISNEVVTTDVATVFKQIIQVSTGGSASDSPIFVLENVLVASSQEKFINNANWKATYSFVHPDKIDDSTAASYRVLNMVPTYDTHDTIAIKNVTRKKRKSDFTKKRTTSSVKRSKTGNNSSRRLEKWLQQRTLKQQSQPQQQRPQQSTPLSPFSRPHSPFHSLISSSISPINNSFYFKVTDNEDNGATDDGDDTKDTNSYPIALIPTSSTSYKPIPLSAINKPTIFYITVTLTIPTAHVVPFKIIHSITPLNIQNQPQQQAQTHDIAFLPVLTPSKMQFTLIKPTIASWYTQLQFDTSTTTNFNTQSSIDTTFTNQYAIHFFSTSHEVRSFSQQDASCQVSLNQLKANLSKNNNQNVDTYLSPLTTTRITGKITQSQFGGQSSPPLSKQFYQISGDFTPFDIITVNCTMILNEKEKPEISEWLLATGIHIGDNALDRVQSHFFDPSTAYAPNLSTISTKTTSPLTTSSSPNLQIPPESIIPSQYRNGVLYDDNIIEWNPVPAIPVGVYLSVAIHTTVTTQSQLDSILTEVLVLLQSSTPFGVLPEDNMMAGATLNDLLLYEHWNQFRDGMWFPALDTSSDVSPTSTKQTSAQQSTQDPLPSGSDVPFIPGYRLSNIEPDTTWLDIAFPLYLWDGPTVPQSRKLSLSPWNFYKYVLKNSNRVYLWNFDLIESRTQPQCPFKVAEIDQTVQMNERMLDALFVPGCFVPIGSLCFSDDQCVAGNCIHSRCVLESDYPSHFNWVLFRDTFSRDNLQSTQLYFASNISSSIFSSQVIMIITLSQLILTALFGF